MSIYPGVLSRYPTYGASPTLSSVATFIYKERICKRKKCVDASCRRSAITLIKSEFILISEYHLLENAENSLSDTADDRYITASAER